MFQSSKKYSDKVIVSPDGVIAVRLSTRVLVPSGMPFRSGEADMRWIKRVPDILLSLRGKTRSIGMGVAGLQACSPLCRACPAAGGPAITSVQGCRGAGASASNSNSTRRKSVLVLPAVSHHPHLLTFLESCEPLVQPPGRPSPRTGSSSWIASASTICELRGAKCFC